MTTADRWLLPEGINEVLPPQALRIEQLRRQLLDLYGSWGYDLVIPPMVEYLESLLTGAGNDLDLQTFKITDQLTGRQMGVRADITPQAARIAAHSLQNYQDGPIRLCYAGSVLHTKAAHVAASRSPIQLGAELFGHSGVESDIEILSLMLRGLMQVGIDNIHVDLGHVGIYRALAQAADLSDKQESELFDAIQRKAYSEINGFIDSTVKDTNIAEMLKQLPQLSGDASVLDKARKVFAKAPAEVAEALDTLEALVVGVKQCIPDANLCFDLSELRGYHYHTGVVFAAYVLGVGQAVAKGGRYDDTSAEFGRVLPATGFSADLKLVADLTELLNDAPLKILAPSLSSNEDDEQLKQVITDLREQGERVSTAFSSNENTAQYDLQIIKEDGSWVVRPIVQQD